MNTTNTTLSLEPAEFTERFINQTKQPIFLTGKAGTGKTTLLKKIIGSTFKNTVIVAPTGIAALNAGGVTIHSFFQLPFAGFIPEFLAQTPSQETVRIESKDSLSRHFNMNKTRLQLMRNLELLIIDEVSMLRADLLDAMDWTLRNARKIHEPFGGVQVLFIGDLLQLPPVVKPDEWNVLRNYYAGMFFFNARVIAEQPPVYVELSKIFRQTDDAFIAVLNNLRENTITPADAELLNQFVKPNFDPLNEDGYITLTTHNNKADEINRRALGQLAGKIVSYAAEVTGEFPEHMYPIDEQLDLKIGAQVMFIKNDVSFEKLFYNGKMGTITALDKDEVTVSFPDEKKQITVEKYEWNNIRYSVNAQTGEIVEEVLGTFVHYPLKLAWAITVHKSQGLTFEKAVLDVSDVFAPGQAYVALSRLRSMNGLVLLNPIRLNGLASDHHVVNYARNKADAVQLSKHLDKGTSEYVQAFIRHAFDWYELNSKWSIHEATYKNAGSKTEKGKNLSWVTAQAQAVSGTMEHAKRFQAQIEKLFARNSDLNFVRERVEAAYDYFFKILDGVLTSNLMKLAELSRMRKTKQYADELRELDEHLTEVILRLKKAKLLVEHIAFGKEITKESLLTEEIKNYKIARLASIQQKLREKNGLLYAAMEDEPILLSSPKKKEERKEKKSTYEQTLELLHEGLDVGEIAARRQVSENTIYNHFVVLLKSEKIELEDVLAQERISKLQDYFTDFEGASLSQLKERHGDEVTWEELKLMQASKII